MKANTLARGRTAVAFLKEESGVSSTEYAVVLAVVILAAVGAIVSLGNSIAATGHAIRNGVPDSLRPKWQL